MNRLETKKLIEQQLPKLSKGEREQINAFVLKACEKGGEGFRFFLLTLRLEGKEKWSAGYGLWDTKGISGPEMMKCLNLSQPEPPKPVEPLKPRRLLGGGRG